MKIRFHLMFALVFFIQSVQLKSQVVLNLSNAVSLSQSGVLNSSKNKNEWWNNSRFGLFIHWGIYSIPAGIYNGQQVVGTGEWIMKRGQIPVKEYREYASQFDPTNFNADEWVKLAKDAGAKYIIFTAKHHDGFAMFNSKASDWNVVKASPFHRDPLQELAAACRKENMQLGFYYSQAQDWVNGGAASGGRWDKAQEGSMDEYIDKIAVPQIKELLTNYGEFPSVLWWDTPTDMNKERAAKIYDAVEELRPDVLMNNKLVSGFNGNFEKFEQHIPNDIPTNNNWEVCMTMNDTWGYKSYDHNFKSSAVLIHDLIDIASKGGNYLLNIGPDATGKIPLPEVECLQEIGSWLRTNGVAIYGSSASPFKKSLYWGQCTQKDGKLYLFVYHWPTDKTLTLPVFNQHPKAWLLTDPDKMFECKTNAAGITIQLPEKMPDPVATVIAVDVGGDVQLASTATQLQ